MPRLYVDKTTEINAVASRVWDVLTSRKYTDQWAPEFSGGDAAFHIESDWTLDSSVHWKDRKGRVLVEGAVTACVPARLLRFTVFDTSRPRPPAGAEDGITYKLTERDGRTVLWVSQGDFSSMPDGVRYRDLSGEIWDRVLAKVKRLAETPSVSE
jgi:uncharacterized protein YndB with AHSA1/START domain